MALYFQMMAGGAWNLMTQSQTAQPSQAWQTGIGTRNSWHRNGTIGLHRAHASDEAMTLRYAHAGAFEVAAEAERLGEAIYRLFTSS